MCPAAENSKWQAVGFCGSECNCPQSHAKVEAASPEFRSGADLPTFRSVRVGFQEFNGVPTRGAGTERNFCGAKTIKNTDGVTPNLSRPQILKRQAVGFRGSECNCPQSLAKVEAASPEFRCRRWSSNFSVSIENWVLARGYGTENGFLEGFAPKIPQKYRRRPPKVGRPAPPALPSCQFRFFFGR